MFRQRIDKNNKTGRGQSYNIYNYFIVYTILYHVPYVVYLITSFRDVLRKSSAKVPALFASYFLHCGISTEFNFQFL